MAMHSERKLRLMRILFLLTGVSMTVVLILLALDENLDFFYAPAAVAAGEAPAEKRIRVGGLVVSGSIKRHLQSLTVEFRLGDLQDKEIAVHYTGILPDLFKEGKGAIAVGMLHKNGIFKAEQILAKHDENYMSPEVADLLQRSDAMVAPE